MSYLDLVKHTYLENWPAALCSLSLAQIDIPLSREEAVALMDCNGEFGTFQQESVRVVEEIRGRVEAQLTKFPKGAFLRLGSRSPKDSWLAHEGMRTVYGECPLRFLLDSSERIQDDLSLAVQNDYTPHLFLREWVDIPKWAEFRCFMQERKLVGISQYHYLDGAFDEILDDPSYIQWAIERFFPDFCSASHLDSVVFDVFLRVKTKQNQRSTEVRLLEINPFFELTDPCLFKWGEMSGQFLFCQ